MDTSLVATSMFDVLATSSVLYTMDSSTLPIFILSYGRKRDLYMYVHDCITCRMLHQHKYIVHVHVYVFGYLYCVILGMNK